MIRNFFPQDTRIAEFISGFGLILTVIFMSDQMPMLTAHHSMPFLAVLFVALGSLQFWAVYDYPKMDLLRCLMAWINGVLWLWMAFSSFIEIRPDDILAALVGITNLYSFIVSFLTLRHKWEN